MPAVEAQMARWGCCLHKGLPSNRQMPSRGRLSPGDGVQQGSRRPTLQAPGGCRMCFGGVGRLAPEVVKSMPNRAVAGETQC